MNISDMNLVYLAILVMTRLLMSCIVVRYYSDGCELLRLLKLEKHAAASRLSYYKRWDPVLAFFPFIWTWIDVLVAVKIGYAIASLPVWLLVSVVVGGRFRSLQEYGHNAIHFALCPSHRWQYFLGEFFCQAPLLKPDMKARQSTHSGQHHPHPNDVDRDPNLARVIKGGMVPGISPLQFGVNLLRPLGPKSIIGNGMGMVRNILLARSMESRIVRWSAIMIAGGMLFLAAGMEGVVFGWLLPVISFYQLFAWWALLAEHRWHVSSNATTRIDREFANARPTDYVGITGWLVRFFIAPTSDAYHLAHSLYPHVRWNYLPVIDAWLKVNEPRYTQHASQGFLLLSNGIPSALSELYFRLTDGEPAHVAEVSDGNKLLIQRELTNA